MVLFILIALASPFRTQPPAPEPAAAAAVVSDAPTIQTAPPPNGVIAAGSVQRATVQAVVKAGAQPFIASVRVAPVMEGARFRGFRLVGIAPGSPLEGSENVRLGDVVVAVNGMAVERPDQFMKAWGSLAKAERIEVKLLRDDQPLVYRWTVGP